MSSHAVDPGKFVEHISQRTGDFVLNTVRQQNHAAIHALRQPFRPHGGNGIDIQVDPASLPASANFTPIFIAPDSYHENQPITVYAEIWKWITKNENFLKNFRRM